MHMIILFLFPEVIMLFADYIQSKVPPTDWQSGAFHGRAPAQLTTCLPIYPGQGLLKESAYYTCLGTLGRTISRSVASELPGRRTQNLGFEVAWVIPRIAAPGSGHMGLPIMMSSCSSSLSKPHLPFSVWVQLHHHQITVTPLKLISFLSFQFHL